MIGRRLLIVGDEPGVFATAATGWGYEVVTATSDRDAIRLLQLRPDLVLLDVDLAYAREVIERAGVLHPIPAIIAVTGLATRTEAFALGHSGVRTSSGSRSSTPSRNGTEARHCE